jgi:hypothetical protein
MVAQAANGGNHRALSEANVCAVLKGIGYDPDAPAWPGLPGIVAPAPDVVDRVVAALGWGRHNRHAQVCAGSILQALMWRAARRGAARNSHAIGAEG